MPRFVLVTVIAPRRLRSNRSRRHAKPAFQTSHHLATDLLITPEGANTGHSCWRGIKRNPSDQMRTFILALIAAVCLPAMVTGQTTMYELRAPTSAFNALHVDLKSGTSLAM